MAKPNPRPHCPGCGEHLQIIRAGNIIDYTHTTGHHCPPKEEA